MATSFNSDTVSPQFEPRNLTRQEKLEQSMSENKAAKKSEKKEFRKAAALTAVSKMLEGKKIFRISLVICPDREPEIC